MRGGRLSSGGPSRFGLISRPAPQPKSRARSGGRLKPAPVEKPPDDLPSAEIMMEALKISSVSPNVGYSATPPLVKRRLEDESFVNHRALLQSGLKCQQDWRLDSQALVAISQVSAALVVRQLRGKDASDTEAAALSDRAVFASADMQRAIIDQCLTITRDLDSLVAMGDAISSLRSRLQIQASKLQVLRNEINAKQKLRADLEVCDKEAAAVLDKEPLPILDEKCQAEEMKVKDSTEELERRRELHVMRVQDFAATNKCLQSLLSSLKKTHEALDQRNMRATMEDA